MLERNPFGRAFFCFCALAFWANSGVASSPTATSVAPACNPLLELGFTQRAMTSEDFERAERLFPGTPYTFWRETIEEQGRQVRSLVLDPGPDQEFDAGAVWMPTENGIQLIEFRVARYLVTRGFDFELLRQIKAETGAQEITIVVPDLDKGRRFYFQAMGFKEVEEIPGFYGAGTSLGGIRLRLRGAPRGTNVR